MVSFYLTTLMCVLNDLFFSFLKEPNINNVNVDRVQHTTSSWMSLSISDGDSLIINCVFNTRLWRNHSQKWERHKTPNSSLVIYIDGTQCGGGGGLLSLNILKDFFQLSLDQNPSKRIQPHTKDIIFWLISSRFLFFSKIFKFTFFSFKF